MQRRGLLTLCRGVTADGKAIRHVLSSTVLLARALSDNYCTLCYAWALQLMQALSLSSGATSGTFAIVDSHVLLVVLPPCASCCIRCRQCALLQPLCCGRGSLQYTSVAMAMYARLHLHGQCVASCMMLRTCCCNLPGVQRMLMIACSIARVIAALVQLA